MTDEDLKVLFIEELLKHTMEIPDGVTMNSIRNNLIQKLGHDRVEVAFYNANETFYVEADNDKILMKNKASITNSALRDILVNLAFTKTQVNNLFR